MKILAIEKDVPGVLQKNIQIHLKEEAYKVWELQQHDIIREIYFRRDQNTAIIILECESMESAHRSLAELPLVKHHMIAFELIPLIPYPGFKRILNLSGTNDD